MILVNYFFLFHFTFSNKRNNINLFQKPVTTDAPTRPMPCASYLQLKMCGYENLPLQRMVLYLHSVTHAQIYFNYSSLHWVVFVYELNKAGTRKGLISGTRLFL